jgi:hypothetical protein
MQILARLDEPTLRQLLDELLPVTILLDDEDAATGRGGKEGRWVSIEPASVVDFVAGQGLRLVTGGKIRWVAAGVPMEATLHSARILLRPVIAPDKYGGRLVFHPSLEEADLKNVPSFFDKGIAALVNRQLEGRSDQIAWDFGRTLALSVHLPPALDGVESLQLSVQNGQVTVTDHAIELALNLSMHFRHKPSAGPTAQVK